MLMCACLWERRIEAGTVWGPSGGETRIRASTKSGGSVQEASAFLHVHPKKCGKEGQSWEPGKMREPYWYLDAVVKEIHATLKKKKKALSGIRATPQSGCHLISTSRSPFPAVHFGKPLPSHLILQVAGGASTELYPLKWANCVQLTSLDATALTS